MIRRKPRRDDEREDVVSEELWNGGDGKIDINYLLAPVDDNTDDGLPDHVTTDPWAATGRST